MRRIVTLLAAALLAAPAYAQTVDGTVTDSEYGSPFATQVTPTGFGDNVNELNALFARWNSSGDLFLGLPGNLETNGNGLVLFLDVRPGGAVAETLDVDPENPGDFTDIRAGFGELGSVGGARTDDWGTDTDGGEPVSPTPGGPSVLDPGFNPDLSLELNAGGGGPGYFINIIDMTVPNEPNDNRDVFLGQNDIGDPAVTQTYTRPDGDATKGSGGEITHAFDNSNTDGVNGFNFDDPPGELGDPLSATTGFEFQFSSDFLAIPDGQQFKMMAFITSGGGDFLSNQFLPGLLPGEPNLGGPGIPGGEPLFDARVFEGDDFALPVPGNLNNDTDLDNEDIDALFTGIADGTSDPRFNLDGQGDVDGDDAVVLVEEILDTFFGDANGDGAVDVTDLGRIGLNFGQSDRGWAEGDFTGDGAVDVTDLGRLGLNFGNANPGGGWASEAPASEAPTVAVPEPTALALLALGFGAALRRRR